MTAHSHTFGALLGVGALVLLAGCAGGVEETAAPAATTQAIPVPTAPVLPAVSVNALMVALTDHSAHVIWDVAETRPQTDHEWLELEYHAIQLAGAGTLISLGGTGPADAGWARLPGWTRFAQDLTDGGVAALAAARARNVDGILAAGDDIVATCEGCHKEFKPEVPTEGLLHEHEWF